MLSLNKGNKKVWSLTDKVNFGKFKDDGYDIEDLIEYEFNYINHLVEDGDFQLDDEAYTLYKSKL